MYNRLLSLCCTHCANLLSFSVYKPCVSSRGNHRFNLSNNTTRLLHNDLSRCSYFRALLLAYSWPASGLSHVFDVSVDHEPILDDLSVDHHPVFVDHQCLPTDHHPVHVKYHHYSIFVDYHRLSTDHNPVHDKLFHYHPLFNVDEAVLPTDHYPVHDKLSYYDPLFNVDETVLPTNHHSVLVKSYHQHSLLDYHPLFDDHPLFKAKLHMLPDSDTLLVLDPVPVRARRR
jgi:hypothetical protein